MIVSPRPENLSEFTTIEADFYRSGFQSLSHGYNQTYLRDEVLIWLGEIEGEVYWELRASDDFYYWTSFYDYVSELVFVFYFRRPADAVLFKIQWFEAD